MDIPTAIEKILVSGFEKKKVRFKLECKLEHAEGAQDIIGIDILRFFADPIEGFMGLVKFKKPCPLLDDRFNLTFSYEETDNMTINGKFGEASIVVKNQPDKKGKEALLRLTVSGLSPDESQLAWIEAHLVRLITLKATRIPEAKQEDLSFGPTE